jgi:undecaprenyl diphosphate synthase
MQSPLTCKEQSKVHVAIIMDGNGRWAVSRGMSRVFGHRAGAKTVERIVEAAPDFGIETLTLFAFSSDNWRRPADEVDALMSLFQEFLAAQTPRCMESGVRLSVIGRRDRLSDVLVSAIQAAERDTLESAKIHLRLAVDYSARDAICRAACISSVERRIDMPDFADRLAASCHMDRPPPSVDLLIRTGGEQRLSDFLLWECAYAELYFTQTMWPEFQPQDLAKAVNEFHSRERRFGGVKSVVAVEISGSS